MLYSLDWLKGKSTGNHRFSIEIWDFPVIFPLNQPIDICYGMGLGQFFVQFFWEIHGNSIDEICDVMRVDC